jgi:hypothetical protein
MDAESISLGALAVAMMVKAADTAAETLAERSTDSGLDVLARLRAAVLKRLGRTVEPSDGPPVESAQFVALARDIDGAAVRDASFRQNLEQLVATAQSECVANEAEFRKFAIGLNNILISNVSDSSKISIRIKN